MFFLKSAAVGIDSSQSIIFNNLYNDILITFSIIFFYLIPFIFFKVIRVENVLNFKNYLITLFIFSICVFNFDYNYSFTGGGIFFKLSNFIFDNNYAFYIISLFAVMIVCPIINKNYTNFGIQIQFISTSYDKHKINYIPTTSFTII